jgi:eukaryotic-like serine/threonine-protein kinase
MRAATFTACSQRASASRTRGIIFFLLPRIGGHDSNVYALDAKTGKQKWVYSIKGSWVNNSAAVYEGKLFLGTSIPGLMHAVDSETGAQVCTLDTGFPVFASIANSNGALYFGALDG